MLVGCGTVIPVEIGVVDKVDEELTSAAVGLSGVCHRYRSALIRVSGHKFILYVVSGTASARAVGTAALNHESRNYAVEYDSVIEAFSYEFFEVACRYRHVVIEFYDDIAHCCL